MRWDQEKRNSLLLGLVHVTCNWWEWRSFVRRDINAFTTVSIAACEAQPGADLGELPGYLKLETTLLSLSPASPLVPSPCCPVGTFGSHGGQSRSVWEASSNSPLCSVRIEPLYFYSDLWLLRRGDVCHFTTRAPWQAPVFHPSGLLIVL